MSTEALYQHWWVNRAIKDETSSFLAVTAGVGSGKTHGEVQWHYNRCIKNVGAPFSGYLMPIYEHIHNTAIPAWRKVLHDYGMEEGADFTVLKTPFPKLILSTGQEVHFLSGNRPDKIKAVEYSHGTIDEPGIMPWESVERFRERVRDKRGRLLQILFGGTPEGMNKFADAFDSDKNPGWILDTNRDHHKDVVDKESGLTLRYRRFRLTTYDNQQFLPAGYIPGLLDNYRGNTAYVEAYINGFFVPLVTGNCYANYMPRKHDIDDREADPACDIELTLDFNAEPVAWAAVQRLGFTEFGERRRRRVVVHEGDQGAGQLDDVAVEFAAKFPVARFGNTLISLYGDMSGHAQSHKTRQTDYQALARYLRELGYRRVEICALRHNPLETVSVDALNRWFLEDELYICRRCANIRRSLISTRWKEGIKKIDKPAGERHTHHSDALKYLAYAIQEGTGRVVKSLSF